MTLSSTGCNRDIIFCYRDMNPEITRKQRFKRKMLSNEIPRFAELEDASKASSRPQSSPSHSQHCQLDNLNFI